MNKFGLLLGACLVAILGVACSSTSKLPAPKTSAVDFNSVDTYRIGIADQLNVVVWRNAELSVNVPVRPDGKISIPLIGDVVAAGKEAPALSEEIEKALASFVRTPNVTVIVTAANNAEYFNRVRITGAVVQPVSVAYREHMTVLDLVLAAGGLSEFASGNGAKLYRKTDAGVKTYNVRLKDIMNKGDIRTNYTLLPSDIVTVPESVF
ncbi:polysaccharide export outer membrane protein [Alteromonadaceae bacterium 2753L.S.0a.02]|nr:polysaccharide export outer membrane protein [Alteromonadaceae bacterium 2753L.S.0a.02]